MENIDEYIWQRRIHHGVRQQKGTVPFPESVKVGLDFNAALERKEKLDPGLLTNAVMLELCAFAKTVTQSEMYFLLEMLDFNFDLGVDLDNDQQYYEYARRAHNKIKVVKDQIRMKTHQRNKDKFSLPDISFLVKIIANEHPGRYYPKRNKMVDTSVLTGGSRKTAEPQKTEISEDTSMVKIPGGLRVKARSYPYCEDLGVSVFVRPEDAPKDKLDPNPLTNGVMLELLEFSRGLCGTQNRIVHDLIKQNFGTKSDTNLFSLQLPKLLERKNACFRTNDSEAFQKETYEIKTLEPKPRKRKAPDYHNLEELVASKRRKR
ncbi:Tudor domain containing protein 5 [Dissostichus eleginoides]|uniref:Tudor domain containing protein 5 n=1 Tax=Dissostichus eleginoides TaxID=100907 RepID=A0AAD9BFP0_DISEL|nr:Tudor domain containing protein 5 [Dissostichus eleginoides]